MKTKFTIFINAFSVLLFWMPNDALANSTQTQQTQNQADVAALFDQAAAKHKRELEDLWDRRGTPRLNLSNVSSKSVARILSERTTTIDYSATEATYLDNTAVLFYSYDRENLQIWLVDERSIQAYSKRRISENQINEAITNLRDSMGIDSLQLSRSPHPRGIGIFSRSQKAELPINRAIAELTEILLPPTIRHELTSVKHLVIVPVLGLATVPFAILQPFTNGAFLIDKMSISIAPSLFDVGQTIPPWDVSRAFSSPLIVGNPYLPPSSDWVVPALPGAEKEAQGVAQIMKVTPLIGKQASKERILSKVQDSSLLYFATHGVASSTNPLSAGFLMFSADRLEQGWWTVKEVQEITIRETQIAVLSACQTGLGKVHDAGIIGLARAFQIAGVPRVIMSLWSVDDAATSELMQAFIKHLENDIPAEALREAMLEVRKQYPAPSQWASFVLFGTPR
jgi:hypothetical protein